MDAARYIYLVRHGETDWNVEQRVMGRLGIDLNDTGSDQIKCSSKELVGKGLKYLYTSPLKRAVTSAKIIARELGIGFTPDPRITEFNFGNWEGKNLPELLQDPLYHDWRSHPSEAQIPGGETLSQVQGRCMEFVSEILNTQTGGHFAIISHSDIIKVILANYMGLPLDEIHKIAISNGSISTIRINGNASCVLTINTTSHLHSIGNA